jgi:hypothetical protein
VTKNGKLGVWESELRTREELVKSREEPVQKREDGVGKEVAQVRKKYSEKLSKQEALIKDSLLKQGGGSCHVARSF